MIRTPAGFDGYDRIKRNLDYFQAGYGPAALSLVPYGTATPAGNVLGPAESGLAVSFTSGGVTGDMLIRSTDVTSSLNYSGPVFQANGGSLIFSRASNATVVDSDDKIKWAPHNFLPDSEQIGLSSWTGLNATVSSNVAGILAPDQTQTADAIFETAANGNHFRQRSVTSFNATILNTAGAFFRANGRTKGFLTFYRVGAGFDGYTITFDLTAVTQSGVAINGGNYVSSGIFALADGWFYVYGIGSGLQTSSTYAVQLGLLDDAGNVSYAGDVTKGMYAWGAHLYAVNLNGMQANGTSLPYYNSTTPKNLLGYTENFTNAAWVLAGAGVSSPTRTTYTGVLPNGRTGTIVRLSIPAGVNSGATYSFMYQISNLAQIADSRITPAIYIKRVSGGTKIGLFCESSTTSPATSGYVSSLVDATDSWTRVSVSDTITNAPAGNWVFGVGLDGRIASQRNQSAIVVDLWGASLSDSNSLPSYVPVFGAAFSASAYYGPRIDYAGGLSKGLLVEEARANSLLNSDTLSTQTITVSATPYTLSFYGTGTVTLSGVSTAGPLVGTGANTRVSLTFTPTAGSLVLTVTGSVLYAQLEAGAFATSYIPSYATAGSRSADVSNIYTSQFPFSTTEGTLYMAFDSAAAAPAAIVGDATSSSLFLYGDGGVLKTYNGGTALGTANSLTANAAMKGAVSYGSGGRSIVLNGSNVATDANTFQANASGLNLGYSAFTNAYLNGHIREFYFVPARQPNNQIQSKTA